MLLINPGSHIGEQSSEKWANTHEQALENALRWLKNIQDDGIKNIRMYDTKTEEQGRWKFIFKHLITGVEVELETHGITDMDEYIKENVFTPRVYWNGSSCGEPELDQWLTDGYKKVLDIVEVGL
jgi:hypothetical protein